MTDHEAKELWLAYCRGEVPGLPPKPESMPERPDLACPDEWRGWLEWLGAVGLVTPAG
jgi:hypothetical protein